MSSLLGKVHDFTGKYDPIGHKLVEIPWKTSTKIVNESSRVMQNIGDKWGINTKIPEKGKNLSERDKGSFSTWGENTAGSIGAWFGAAYLAGEGAAGAAGGAGEAGAGVGGVGEVSAGTVGAGEAGAGAGAVGGGEAGGTATVGEAVPEGGYMDGDGFVSNTDYNTNTNSGGWQWDKTLKQSGGLMQQMGAQKKQPEPIEQSNVHLDGASDPYRENVYARSSSKSKTGAHVSMREIVKRKTDHPIDVNGMQIGAIKALSARVAHARTQLQALKGAQQ